MIEARENMPPYPHPELSNVVSERLVDAGDGDRASLEDARLVHRIVTKMYFCNLFESLLDLDFPPLQAQIYESRFPLIRPA